jgi:hypothetical protein
MNIKKQKCYVTFCVTVHTFLKLKILHYLKCFYLQFKQNVQKVTVVSDHFKGKFCLFLF